jgi:hypothetical protein
MTRTGKAGLIHRFFFGAAMVFIANSAEAAIRASVDRTEVPLDESISLKIADAGGGPGGEEFNPKFDAPDFEVMNQFQNSSFSSVYINGRFENKSETSITFILKPQKLGALKIRNISNHGERAADITIQVIQENLYKKAAPGEAPTLTGDAKNFFVKAELSKSRVYKGEQIVVSYYLYRRTRANVRDVLQYPNFQGFIREDLEMPILSNRPDFEAVNLGGIPFERALLARYAVYPIKDGKLRIDGFSVRVDYIPKNPGSEDMMEDPFFQFFTQVAPRTGSAKSDPVTVDVLPLPEEGKSSAFTGGVGDFEVNAQLDPGAIKANAPFTLRYSVRGKGNTSLIEFPQVSWPKDLRLYQSQGKTKNLGQGQQEKTFEVVIIPSQTGHTQVPPIEFEFFNPETRSYQKKSSPAIPVEVLPGEAGSSMAPSDHPPQAEAPNQTRVTPTSPDEGYGSTRTKEQRLEGRHSMMGEPLWRWVSWFGLAVFFGFVGLVIWDQTKKRSILQLEGLKRKQGVEQRWKALLNELDSANSQTVSGLLEKAKDELYKTLDDSYSLSSRAMPIRDLSKILTETHGVSGDQVKTLTGFLEFTEMVRFSSGATFSTAEETVRVSREWVESIQKICLDLQRNPLEKQA